MTSFSDRKSLLSKTNKLAKNDKILIRDKAIIEQEIQNFDKRLYDDLTCGKYDYGYLCRFVAGRKKQKLTGIKRSPGKNYFIDVGRT